MLYQIHEMQRSILEPWRWWAEASVDVLQNPFSPLSYAPHADKAEPRARQLAAERQRPRAPLAGAHEAVRCRDLPPDSRSLVSTNQNLLASFLSAHRNLTN